MAALTFVHIQMTGGASSIGKEHGRDRTSAGSSLTDCCCWMLPASKCNADVESHDVCYGEQVRDLGELDTNVVVPPNFTDTECALLVFKLAGVARTKPWRPLSPR